MSFDLALRLTEIMLGFAFILQSIEHLRGPKNEQILYIPRLVLSALLMLGLWTPWVCLGLVIIGLFILNRFQGPYNGGSDRMNLLVLCCLCLAHFMPTQNWREIIFGYLAIQLILSYFISGFVKIVNPQWRNGQALEDVFRFSAYPASEKIRGWAEHSQLPLVMSWAVIVFELLFLFAFLTLPTLIVGLVIAASFHLANACLFGLNRFFWTWLAAYPSILWFQGRIFDVGSLP